MLKNMVDKRKKEMINSINIILNIYGGELISFEYYYKIFGNIVIEIEKQGKMHVFVSDRGEIRHNQEIVFEKSFRENGLYDPFFFIMKAIENELKKCSH